MKLDFLIIYELVQRELENVLLIGVELEKRGYTVEYCKYPFEKPFAKRNKYFNNVKVVLAHSMYNNNVLFNLVYNIAGPVEKIVNLQWEQVMSFVEEEDLSNHFYPKDMAKEVLHICWGNAPRNNLIKAGISPNKAVVVGPVHMDFLRPEFSCYYKPKEVLFNEFGLDTRKKTILFISSFSYASLDEKQLTALSKILGESFVKEFLRISVQSQNQFLDWIEKLLSENPPLTFIYRPHPAENDNVRLKRIENTYANFKIICDYSVKQWIIVTDKIYTWYSTSIAEAFFSNTPCAIIRPIMIPKELEVTIMHNTPKITNYTMFRESIDIEQNALIDANIVKEYYDVDNLLPAYIRISNLLEIVIKSNCYDLKWNNYIISQFNKKLRIAKMKTILLFINNVIIKILTIIKDKTGISFSARLDKKIDRHRRAKAQKAYNHKIFAQITDIKKILRAVIDG